MLNFDLSQSGALAAVPVLSLVLLVAPTAAAGDPPNSPAPAPGTPPAVTSLYHGGPIITMEAGAERAESVVTTGARIVFVGDLDGARQRYPGARDIDLAGRTLMPGFIEQHLHPLLGALTLAMPVIAPEAWELPDKTWPAVTGSADYLAALTAVERQMDDPSEVLWTWGFNNFFHGSLDREKLDKISPTRPIVVWHRSCHEFYVNSAFIERFAISQAAVDELGPQVAGQVSIERGHFYESGALVYLFPIIAPELASRERFKRGLTQMVAMLQRRGVTAYHEPGAFIPDNAVPLYRAILGADTTPLYSFFSPESKTPYFRHGEEGVLAAVEEAGKIFPAAGKLRFLPRQVKILFDGAIISQLMQMQDGYLDGHEGEWIQTPQEVDTITRIFWNADYQIMVHVNGDLGVKQLLEILQRRQREYPRQDHRFTIVHMANTTDDQVKELAELGAIFSVNPYYVTGFSEKFAETGLGKERAYAMARLATAERYSAHISLHSDLPMAPADPLFLAWSATTRHTNEGTTPRPDLALSREAALRAITIEAAYSWGMEDSLGSLRAGKVANFTLLERDPYAVKLEELKDIAVYATVFEGRLFPVPR